MDKLSYEKLDDWVINLYRQWIFIRCYEKTALYIWEITWYNIYPNIDKKTGFVYLELWFPELKLEEIVEKLEQENNYIRIIDNKWSIDETVWTKKEIINSEKLLKIKKELLNF